MSYLYNYLLIHEHFSAIGNAQKNLFEYTAWTLITVPEIVAGQTKKVSNIELGYISVSFLWNFNIRLVRFFIALFLILEIE